MWFLNGLEGQIEIRNDDLGFDIWTTLGFVDYRRSNITLSSRFSSISQSRRRRSSIIVVHIGANVFLKLQSVKWDRIVFLSFQILFLNHICKGVATQQIDHYLSPHFVPECTMYKVHTYGYVGKLYGRKNSALNRLWPHCELMVVVWRFGLGHRVRHSPVHIYCMHIPPEKISPWFLQGFDILVHRYVLARYLFISVSYIQVVLFLKHSFTSPFLTQKRYRHCS